MLPDFIIIGAQKSASTFMHYCLREHPDVYMPATEVPFFEGLNYVYGDISDLEALLSGASQGQVTGIKRPSYLCRPECPGRIYKHIPDTKLIAVLRDPVERAISDYFHHILHGFIPVEPVETGMVKVVDGDYAAIDPRAQDIIEFGFYHKYLTHYFEYFGRNQLLILFHKDVKAEPLGTVRQAYRFVGVDDNYVPHALHQHPQSSVYSTARLRFIVLRNRFLFTYNEDRTGVHLKQQSIRDRLVVKSINLVDRAVLSPLFGNEKPILSEGLARTLFRIYEDDIHQLEQLLERDLTNWKR